MSVAPTLSSQSPPRFSMPRQRRTLARPRLLDALHGGIGSGLMVVQAPAGYGKTALLASFAPEVDYSLRWLSLDASCNSPEVFAEQLATALLGDDVAPPATAARLDDLKAYLRGVVSAADGRTEQPLMFVIDNVHELRDAVGSAELLGWLLETMPEGMELILSGREAAPLTAIDERVATGGCLLIGASDLAFTEAEIGELADQADREVKAGEILKQTGGWPVGVLAVLASSVTLDGSGKREAGAAWERYLVSQVWDRVPADLRAVLMQLSVPEVVDAETAEALAGRRAWSDLSNWLGRHDFLFEGYPGGELRLNPLVRQFLRSEFQRVAPEGFAATIGQIAARMEAAGRVTDAIELAREARHLEALAGLLERHSRRLIYQGATALLWRGYELLTPGFLAERPMLRSIRARVLSHAERPHEALEEAAEILADSSAPRDAHVHAMLARIRAFRMLARIDELRALFNEMRSATATDDPGLVAELKYQEGYFELTVDADFGRAERLLNETIQLCREGGGIQPLEMLAESTLGQLLTMRGDGPASVTALTRAAQGWREFGRTSNLGWVLNNLGMAHVLSGDFESAVSALEEARREGEACENTRNMAYAIASLGDAELALGRYARARAHYEETLRLAAESVPDESLAALSIAGLSAAMVGLGELQEADFFSERAMLVANAFGNPFELATCKLQRAQVDSATGNHAAAVAAANEAISLLQSIDGKGPLRTAYYRLALCQFRANHRSEAQVALGELERLLTEPWMTGALLPLVRENPMFAQWVASRNLAGPHFRGLLERSVIALDGGQAPPDEAKPARLPRVQAQSLGTLHVTVGAREVTDEAWSSLRAKELFFLFLAHRGGLRKEEAVEALYPDLPAEKCNSAFHSNLYRVRKAIYQESVVKRDGTYVLNPEGEFTWDVDGFEAALEQARQLPPGSEERARRYEQALKLYRGPFAQALFSEWTETIRRRVEEQAQEALSVLAGYFAGREDYEAAATCMEKLLERDRFNEEAAYQLAGYRMKAGQPVVALAVIDEYRRAYEEELGERAPERFGRLRAQIAAGAG